MRFLASAFLSVFVPGLVSAQDTRGSISGTVTDSQAAVVAGASVIVANLDTGTITRLTSNRSGYYEARLLLPGSYSVTVEMTGFKKSVRTGVTLALSEQSQINIQPEVGGTTESLTVSAETLLDTSTVSTGRALTNREVMDLPVIGNNILMLTRLAPGVQSPGTTQFLVQGQVGDGSDYRMPGRVGGNEWSLDGASTNGTDRRVSYMPSPDVIDEFKIETSNFDASFGHSTGLNISMSTKSGANAFHGSATEQYFNARWNAVAFFTRQARYQQIAAARAAGNTALANDLANSPMVPPGTRTNSPAPSAARSTSRRCSMAATNCSSSWATPGSGIFNRPDPARSITRCRPWRCAMAISPSCSRSIPILRGTSFTIPCRYASIRRAGHWVRTPFTGNIVPSARFKNPLYTFYAKRMPMPNNDPSDPTKEPINNFNASSMPNNV